MKAPSLHRRKVIGGNGNRERLHWKILLAFSVFSVYSVLAYFYIQKAEIIHTLFQNPVMATKTMIF